MQQPSNPQTTTSAGNTLLTNQSSLNNLFQQQQQQQQLLAQTLLPQQQQQQQQQSSNSNNNGAVQKDTTFTKIFVGGLPYHTTDESLRAFFLKFGQIDEAVVIIDRQTGKSKGYGFVSCFLLIRDDSKKMM